MQFFKEKKNQSQQILVKNTLEKKHRDSRFKETIWAVPKSKGIISHHNLQL